MIVMRYPGGLGKALTLSYDDGVEQDQQLMAILDKYGLRCTFNLNSGCWMPEGHQWAAGTIHRRMTLSQAKALYNGTPHEVAVHCLTHASLIELPMDRMIHEIMTDRVNLERDFGGIIRGFAYPFGTFNDQTVEALRSCGIIYGRTVISSHDFSIPQDWLRLPATCHHDDPRLMELADAFLAASTRFGSKLFYLWGHSYEFDANNNWDRIEAFAQKLAHQPDVWYATNIEIFSYIEAFRQLRYSADGTMVHNPTAISVTIENDGRIMEIKPGETVKV